MKKLSVIGICILPLLFLWSNESKRIEVTTVKLTAHFPQQSIYFKTLPKIDLDKEGLIYAVDNREHTVFKFNRDGELLANFGRWGQGPGELQWPANISVDKSTGLIFVKDNTGIVMYDPQGSFIRRVRTFTQILNFDAAHGRIAVLEPIPGKQDLIGLYDYQGQRINSIGQKYDLDYSLSKEIAPGLLDRIANDGAALFDGNYVYYVSYLFGEIRVYDLSGLLMLEKKLSGPGNLEKYREQYRKIFFEKGVKKNSDGTVTNWRIFGDACLDGGYLYLLMLGYVTGDVYEVLVVDKKSLEIRERIILPDSIYPEMVRVFPSNEKNSISFAVSYQDKTNGAFMIGIFQKYKKEGLR